MDTALLRRCRTCQMRFNREDLLVCEECLAYFCPACYPEHVELHKGA